MIAARLPSPFHACAASGAYHWLLLCSRPPSFLIFVYTQVHALHNMASHTARSKKIVKEKGAEPDEFEESVAQVRLGVGRTPSHSPANPGNVEMEQALFDLEATNTELKADLRDLYITSAREIDIRDSTRKAIIVHVSGGANSALLRGGEKWQPTPTAGRVTHKTAIKLALNLALSQLGAGALPPAQGLPQDPAEASPRAGEEVLRQGCRADRQPPDPATQLHRQGHRPPPQPHPDSGASCVPMDACMSAWGSEGHA